MGKPIQFIYAEIDEKMGKKMKNPKHIYKYGNLINIKGCVYKIMFGSCWHCPHFDNGGDPFMPSVEPCKTCMLYLARHINGHEKGVRYQLKRIKSAEKY